MAAPVPHDTAGPVTETAGPTETPPVFASNDEALAAAEAVYTKYLALGDSAGARDPDSWKEYMALTTGTELQGVERAKR